MYSVHLMPGDLVSPYMRAAAKIYNDVAFVSGCFPLKGATATPPTAC